MKLIASFFLALALAAIPAGKAAFAESAKDLDRESHEALDLLYRSNPTAASIGKQARAVLIFPKIVKAGLVFGGSYGEGELIRGGKVENYYNSVSGSWGLQAGAQSYGYVVFLISNKAEQYIHKSEGWEIGVGPTVVLMDEGAAKNFSTSTLQADAYAFIFDQSGLMAGISLEGSKITQIKR